METQQKTQITEVFENLIMGEFEGFVTRINKEDPGLYAKNPPEWLTMSAAEQKVYIASSIFWGKHFQHFLLSEIAFDYYGWNPDSSPEQDIRLVLKTELPNFFKLLRDEQLAEYVDDNGEALPPSDDYNEQFKQILNNKDLLVIWNHFLLKQVVEIWIGRANFDAE